MQRPVVPADAVALRGKTWHAFVIVNGEVHDRVIQLGTPPAKGMEAIVKGVAVGEQLVRHVRGGNPQIVDGLRVETTGASPPPAPAAN
jgi:hypothetical protein